jgi:hypothetical protein
MPSRTNLEKHLQLAAISVCTGMVLGAATAMYTPDCALASLFIIVSCAFIFLVQIYLFRMNTTSQRAKHYPIHELDVGAVFGHIFSLQKLKPMASFFPSRTISGQPLHAHSIFPKLIVAYPLDSSLQDSTVFAGFTLIKDIAMDPIPQVKKHNVYDIGTARVVVEVPPALFFLAALFPNDIYKEHAQAFYDASISDLPAHTLCFTYSTHEELLLKINNSITM